MPRLSDHGLHRISRALVHAFIVAFGVLGFTPWQTGSVQQAGFFGWVECAALIVLGTFGVVAAIRDRTLAEIIVLRAESLTFLVVSAAAVALLIDDGFQQWQGVMTYLALSASLGSRSLSLARALSLIVEVRRG